MQDEWDAPIQFVLGQSFISTVFVVTLLMAQLNTKLYLSAMESQFLFCFCDDFWIPDGVVNYFLIYDKGVQEMQNSWGQRGQECNEMIDVGLAQYEIYVCMYLCAFLRYPQRGKIRIGGGKEMGICCSMWWWSICLQMSPTIDPSNMDSFVLSHAVVQNARKRLPDIACLVLGKALMWMTTLFCWWSHPCGSYWWGAFGLGSRLRWRLGVGCGTKRNI